MDIRESADATISSRLSAHWKDDLTKNNIFTFCLACSHRKLYDANKNDETIYENEKKIFFQPKNNSKDHIMKNEHF